MRKIIKSFLILLLFIPFIVNAKGICTVVSGDGKEVGSELECGTEHFYVIENKDKVVKMLAKYNLNVGDKIDYFDVESETPLVYDYNNTASDLDAPRAKCETLATEKGYNYYYVYPIMGETYLPEELANTYHYKFNLVGCRVYEYMNEEYTRQDSRAIGTKFDGNGKSILPLYGITYMNPEWAPKNSDGSTPSNNYDENGDLYLEDSENEYGAIYGAEYFKKYLNDYKSELTRQGISADSISFIHLSGAIDLIKKVSGVDLQVQLEYETQSPSEGHYYINPSDEKYWYYTGKMDLKNIVPQKYNWIHSISYWLGSGFYLDMYQHGENNYYGSQYNDYFISNEGMLCAIGRGYCSYLAYPIGNGVRPLVTMSEDNITYVYNIESETDGKGSIEVVKTAHAEDKITFRVEPKPNYKISSITITDKAGNAITFDEDEIIQNEDGTVSVNSFTMPSNDVKIIAKFESVVVAAVEEQLINPKTGVFSPLYIFLATLFISGIAYVILLRKSIADIRM